MATSIRLTRMGRKQAPFYRLVVCDSRTRRDGAYIESLGHYNPMPDAFDLNVDHNKAIAWLDKGAQPTDTARSLLRTEGVLYRWHLIKSGTPAEQIDGQVEEFRARREKSAEAVKAASAQKIADQKKAREEAAAAEVKAAADAAEAAAAEEAAKAAAEAAEEATKEPAEAADDAGEATEDSSES